jgi:hypothetical protein
MKPFLFLPILFLSGCFLNSNKNNSAQTKMVDTSPSPGEPDSVKLFLHKLNKLFTTGDFDGDGKTDTIFQHNCSELDHTEIDTAPDPIKNDWYSVVQWFDQQYSDVYLCINKKNTDTLHVGTGQGLYCLLNLGDINKDGKDEIAFVIDLCDFSHLNSCKVYGLCNNKWISLKSFGMNESAFDFTGDSIPLFSNIPGYLEKQHDIWMYHDYDKDYYTGKMIPLKISHCK